MFTPNTYLFLPLIYLVWSDDLLTADEFSILSGFIQNQRWLSDEEKLFLESHLNLASPPSRSLLNRWKNELGKVILKNPNLTTLFDLQLKVANNDSASQYRENFEVLEQNKQWAKIKLQYDNYEGWVDSKQFQIITKSEYDLLSEEPIVLNSDLIEYITTPNNSLMTIPLGASLSFLNHKEINVDNYEFEGTKISGIKPKSNLINTSFMYLNAPYLWGGKTPFGIDCSGFTQMVYKLNGYYLSRDASQQAVQGEALSFIEESEPGDLAFFDNEEGKIIHVGIIMDDNYIIHASGKVRIDRLDHLGIYNADLNRHTHKLRVIKKII